MPKIILSMIVKNESARIERFLRSVAPHLSGAMITDTGSTDGTQSTAMRFLFDAGVPCQCVERPFVDFSTSRNAALEDARGFAASLAASPEPIYFLLADADMELVALPHAFAALSAPAYTLVQKHGGMEYRNTRLLRADVPAHYAGRTHEVLHVEGVMPLHGPHFIDHADGSNRPGKFERDIQLLQQDLAENPSNPRALFYLGQSYRDLGLHGVAVGFYDRRVAAGGWDEEVYCSLLYAGRSYLAMGDEANGLDRLHAAYTRRPTRAEAPAALSRHYRLKPDRQAVALLWAQAAMETPPTEDALFVEPDARAEAELDFAICAWYSIDRAIKIHGFYVCNSLATSRDVPALVREIARSNLMWYAEPLEVAFPGVKRVRIDFPVEDGWWPMNASILKQGETLWFLQRVVSFKVDKVTGAYTMPDGITRTRNFLCTLDRDTFAITSRVELRIEPAPQVSFPWVLGFEDMRLFEDGKGELWVSATTRQLAPNGLCEIVEGRIHRDRVEDWRVVSDNSQQRNEKNWAPIIGKSHAWLYMHDPAEVSFDRHRMNVGTSPFAIDNFRGSSQLLPTETGYIAVEHEVIEAFGPRKYIHRFVRYDKDCVPVGFTLPFHFAPLAQNGNQFNCGLALDKGNYLVPYSLNDEESWLAVVPVESVGERL